MSQKSYTAIKLAIEQVADSLQSHILAMQKDAKRKEELRKLENGMPEFESIQLPLADEPDEQFETIKQVLERHDDDYRHVLINEYLPDDRKLRHYFLNRLKEKGISVRSTLYTSVHRGSHESLHFMWKIPNDGATLESQTRVIDRVREEIPKFHRYHVKRNFAKQAAKLSVNPKSARLLYKIATEDASASTDSTTAVIDARIMEYVLTGDADIVLDLRSLRQNPTSFNDFFNLAATVIEEEAGTAVDDRRHNSIVHLAAAMSGADLYR